MFKRILLIDDDEPTNYLNNILLTEMKLAEEIVIMQTAIEALNYIDEKKKKDPSLLPELIFLDLNLPAMDGWEFMHNFEQMQIHIDIIILTTSLNPDDRELCRNFPSIKGFVSKPLSKDAIEQLLPAIEH